MDSFYPKFGEVEMVFVDDENDFFDPLETNFECEDENEDTKLQLNDSVDTQWSSYDLTENGPSKGGSKSHQLMNDEATDGNVRNCNSLGQIIKVEGTDASSNDSVDAGQIDESCDNIYLDDSSIELSNEVKVDPEVVLNSNAAITSKQNTNQSDDVIEVEPVAKIETVRKQTKIKPKPKLKREESVEASTSISETDTKKENNKTTRHYSKRNEIPKKAKHNEAYDKKLLFCKICKIQFERSPLFTEHMRSKHSIDKPFECFICSKPYRICSLLAEHIRYHFGEKPYKCKVCDRSFSQLQPYKAHIRKSHTHERPYKCNFVYENNIKCEETFFDTKTYKFHLREHTNEQPFTCEFCSKKFNHSGTYQAHMRIHTNERPYQCVICGKSFAQISTHKAHMLTHSDEFKFPCTEPGCDKKFKQATNLKLHMRVHTKETPYKCEDCGRGFAQLVTYRNHRRIHTGEKPFQCTYTDCGKCFRHRNSYRRHLQTHTGEKPFECKVCFKRLSQTSSYVSHMRRHEKPEKKVDCPH